MQTAPAALFVLATILSCSGWVASLCNLENGTVAKCHELEDVKYIETYDLEWLKASVMQKQLTPGPLDNLVSLKHLDLSGGDLEHVGPGSFRKLTNLRSLDLADNRIGYLELAAFDGLHHLRGLNLRKNKLRQLPPALARLKILRHLDVQGNPLECNCASLRVRDLIVKRGVKISKKTVCVGPSNMKGTSLLIPDATKICNLEEQDHEMQRDQAFEGSGHEDDPFDELDAEEEEEVEEHTVSEAPVSTKEEEVETPYPESSEATTTSATSAATDSGSAQEVTSESVEINSTATVSDSLEKVTEDDDEIVFDSDDNKERTPTLEHTTENKVVIKDSLFYPVEGSGDDEGSGEGSGTGIIFPEEVDVTTTKKDEETGSSDNGFLDMLFGVFWSTTSGPDEKKDPDLEEEQFIDASSTKEAEEEPVVTKKIESAGIAPTTVESSTIDNLFGPTNGIEVVDEVAVQDTSKLGNVKQSEETVNDELSEVSPARQSKKGMGSYVVLAALLAILAGLIGFAAYKGDFCRKKRKRGDVENGTEMKDMQKALLDGSNAAQPKIASNGNAESVPLVEGTPDQEDKDREGHPGPVDGSQKPPNGTADHAEPVKPPRRAVSSQDSLKDDSLSARTSSIDPVGSSVAPSNGPTPRIPEVSVPPLSPGAQRVKITLQENPDSVPRTPILITRTMAGENLVKTATP